MAVLHVGLSRPAELQSVLLVALENPAGFFV